MKTLVYLFLCFVLLAETLSAGARTPALNNAPAGSRTHSITSEPTDKVQVEGAIDPGMELIAIMLWLSNSYSQPKDSAYKSAVWAYFGRYHNDPLLAQVKKMEIYPDFTEIGLLFSDFPNARIAAPKTSLWYDKYGREKVLALLADALTFADKTNFWRFHQQHDLEYKQWTTGFAKDVKDKNVLSTLNSFYRYGAEQNNLRVTIYLEPLNGWGAHAINFMNLRGEPNGARVCFQIGPSGMLDELPDSVITFKGTKYATEAVWHEASHVYLRSSLERSKVNINELERLFNRSALANQNVKAWDYAFEENLVRAIVAVIIKQQSGDEAYLRDIRLQTQRGFIYTNEIAELILSEYVANKEKYANFNAFLPNVISMLSKKQSPSDAKTL